VFKESEGMTINVARDKMYKISKDFERLTKELNTIINFLEERGKRIENRQDVEIMRATIASFEEVSESIKSAGQWMNFLDQYGPISD